MNKHSQVIPTTVLRQGYIAVPTYYKEGDQVLVTVKKPYKSKSKDQRGYEHAVLYGMVAEEFGCTLQEVKEHCKRLFLLDTSGKIPVTRSTEDLTTLEAEQYYESIRRYFSLEFGILLPLPNEIIWIDDCTFTFDKKPAKTEIPCSPVGAGEVAF